MTRRSPRLTRLEEALTRIQQEITLERAALARLAALEADCRSAMAEPSVAARRPAPAISPDDVLDGVCYLYGITRDALTGRSQKIPLVDARGVAGWVLHADGYSYPQIGALLNRDHTSVLNAVRRLRDRPQLTEDAARLRANLLFDIEEARSA